MRAALMTLALVAGCSSSMSGPPSNSPTLFYVANTASSSITAYATTDTGNAAPSFTIIGTNTTLAQPQGIVVDPAGVLITTSANPGRIIVFAAHAVGDIAPTASISGSNTRLSHPAALALDQSGQLYVADSVSDSVLTFANGASGNVAPRAVIGGSNTLLSGPGGIAFDGKGRLYVANTASNTITIFAATASGNARPVDTIAGGNTGLDAPRGIALDPAGRIYVTNASSGAATSSVTVYAATARGNATPIATIAGTNTGLDQPQGIALDPAGRIVVASSAFASHQYRITVYNGNANGNVPPLATIAGIKTGLSVPSHLSF